MPQKKRLKIAIFCTNEWPTPPPQNTFYAPLWIAYYIAEGLSKRGHLVYYFGSKESKLKYARLVSEGMPAIKYNKKVSPFLESRNEEVVNLHEQFMLSKLYQIDQREHFDIIHIHPYRRILPFVSLTKTPTVITIHDPIEGFTRHILETLNQIKSVYFISLSKSQTNPSPHLRYAGIVYNGIDTNRFQFNDNPENFFLTAGRFAPAKGIDLAVKAARLAGVKLKIAGGPAEGDYFETRIKPYLNDKIRYVGMVDYYKMGELYKRAKGLLYALRWEEPFGLVIVEAMACGTPVIGFPKGSIPELIKDRKTGFIVEDIQAMVEAIQKIQEIDRKDCRKWVEENFTIEKMVDRYEKIFLKIAGYR